MSDLCVLMTAVILFFLIQKIASNRKKEQPDSLHSVKVTLHDKTDRKLNESDKQQFLFYKTVGNFSSITALAISGAMSPSLLNFVYFVVFLASSSYLAININLFKKFAIILRALSFLIFIHILSITCFQNPWFYSSKLFQTSILSRILGFKRILIIDNAEHINFFKINDELKLDMIFHPFVLMLTYFVITYNASYILVSFIFIKT